MPDYYEQPDYLKDLYDTNPPLNTNNQPLQQGNIEPLPTYNPVSPQQSNPVQNTNPEKPKIAVVNKFNLNKRTVIIGAIVIVVLLILCLIVLLFSNRTTSTPQKENVVLQWWGAFLENDVVQPLLDKYKEENPNVTVEYANRYRNNELYTDEVERYKAELDRVLTAGNQVEIPDIFMVDSNWVGNYEIYSKASTSYDPKTFSDAFYDSVVTNFTRNNKVLGVPLWIDTFAVVYNKNLLNQNSVQEPPSNWSAFRNLARDLTKVTNKTVTQAGFAAGTSKNIDFASDLLKILILQNGVSLTDELGKPIFAA